MSVKSKKNLLAIIKNNRNKIKSYGVLKLGLFGSFRRDEQDDNSDVDLLVEFDPQEKNFDNFINLNFFFEDLFDRTVEVVTLQSLSPYMKPHILKEVEYVDLTK